MAKRMQKNHLINVKLKILRYNLLVFMALFLSCGWYKERRICIQVNCKKLQLYSYVGGNEESIFLFVYIYDCCNSTNNNFDTAYKIFWQWVDFFVLYGVIPKQ